MVAIVPLGYYAAVELSRPASEPMSSGIIMVFGMIFGIGLAYYISIMCDHREQTVVELQDNVRICVFVIIGFLALAAVLVIWIKPQDKEQDAEEDNDIEVEIKV